MLLTLGGSLLSVSLILSGQYEGAAALPNPSHSGQPLQKRATTLSKDSSCNDVSNYQTENKITRIQADMYDLLDAHAVLDEYFFNNGDDTGEFTNYVSGFAAPYV